MKKTLVALAVLVAAGSVNAAEVFKSDEGSVDFYGQLRQELKFLEDKDPTLTSGSSRMGVKAAYSATDDLKVLGLVEISVRENKDMYIRQHQVGFSGDSFGTVKFGKAFTLSDDVYGADYSYFFGGTALRYGTLSGAEHSSQIKYEFSNDDFWLKAAYGFSEDDAEQELTEVFVGKSFGDAAVHVGGGVNSAKKFAGQFDLTNTYFEGTVEYTLGDALIGFTYYNATLENDKSSFEIQENAISLAGTYKVADKTTVYAGYEYTEQDPSAGSKEDGSVLYAGVEYKFASWARVYAEYGYQDGTTLGYTKDSANVQAQRVDGDSNFGIGARVYW